MRMAILTFCLLGVVCGIGARGSMGGQKADKSEMNTFMKIYYSPPEDPDVGYLFNLAADVLAEARKLPEDVRLWKSYLPAEPIEVSETIDRTGWISIGDGPVISLARMGRVYLKARQYEKAAKVYAELAEKYPGDSHYKVLSILSRHMAGELKLDSAEGTEWDEEEDGWLCWMLEVNRLFKTLDEGEL